MGLFSHVQNGFDFERWLHEIITPPVPQGVSITIWITAAKSTIARNQLTQATRAYSCSAGHLT